jgi:hypothetical protein
LNDDSLKESNVVVLDDVARLAPQQIKSLLAFANMGGGILFLPGNHVVAQLKGNPLYQAGTELLPIMLLPPIAPPKPKLVDYFDRQNPIFRFVSLQPDPFASVPFIRFFPIGARAGNVRTLARLRSNDSLLIESPLGRGHVLLLASPIDPGWNALANSSLLAPLLQSIVRYLDQGPAVDRNLWPSQAIVVTTDEPVEDRSATVQFSTNGQRDPAALNRAGEKTEIRYGKTARPGTYRLRYRTAGKERLVNFVVHASHGDSDLTPLTESQWRTLADRVGFSRVDLSNTTVADAINLQRGGREIWIDLIAGVVLLMMIEMVLSRTS